MKNNKSRKTWQTDGKFELLVAEKKKEDLFID